MKADELMVGDWISYRGIVNKVAPADFCQKAWIDEIEPILLTAEILEKNGFENKEGGKGLFGVTIAPRYLCKGVPFEVFCDGEPFAIWFKEPIDIKYVHQLQHALRLCGITREIII